MAGTLRIDDADGVRSIILTRAAEYNTITPDLRDELGDAIDEADAARDVRVILLRAEARPSARATASTGRRSPNLRRAAASRNGTRSATCA